MEPRSPRLGWLLPWLPFVASGLALMGVLANANTGWPLKETATLVGAVTSAFALWYGTFTVGLIAFRRYDGRPLRRAAVAAGLTALLAAVTSALTVPPMSARMFLFDYPGYLVARAFDVNFEASRVEEWRCDALEWEKRSPGERSVEWAGFFEDGRIVAVVGIVNPPPGTGQSTWSTYSTVLAFNPDGTWDRGFSERFHECLVNPQTTAQRSDPQMLVVGDRFLLASMVPTDKLLSVSIQRVIDHDGTALTQAETAKYGEALTAIYAERLEPIFDESGRGLLLAADRDGRLTLLDPHGASARALRTFDFPLHPYGGIGEVALRGDRMLAASCACDGGTSDVLVPWVCESDSGRTVRREVPPRLPGSFQLGDRLVKWVAPLAVVGDDVLLMVSVEDPKLFSRLTLARLSPEGAFRGDLDVAADDTSGFPRAARVLRDGRVGLVAHDVVMLVPPRGRASFLDQDTSPSPVQRGESVFWWLKGEQAEAISAEGRFLTQGSHGFTVVDANGTRQMLAVP